jgi:hypothetical protein
LYDNTHAHTVLHALEGVGLFLTQPGPVTMWLPFVQPPWNTCLRTLDLYWMKMSRLWWDSGSSSSLGNSLWRESLRWCTNGVSAVMPMVDIFNGL